MIRVFKQSDLQSIQRWCAKRGVPAPKLHELPELGFTIPGVAIGFIRRCEGLIGIIDGIITNPLVSGAIRHKCLNEMIEHLVKQDGFNNVIIFTADETMLKRFGDNGFVPTKHKLLIYSQGAKSCHG